MSEAAPALTPTLLQGTWIGISHQTITVTHCLDDGTFCGTYFTPDFQLTATFEGTWQIEGETLILRYTGGNLPVAAFPYEDPNQVEVLSRDSIILRTIPAGISITWNRVQFAPRPGLAPLDPVNPPTFEELRAMTLDDLFSDNPLEKWILSEVSQSTEENFDDQLLDGLTRRVPRKAGFYMAMFQFEGLWGNGGMQHALLREPVETNLKFLDLVAEAHTFFGSEQLTDLVRNLRGKTEGWMAELARIEKAESIPSMYKVAPNKIAQKFGASMVSIALG